MGQLITVVEKPSPRPDVVRLELNRTLTGMSHERFCSRADASGGRIVDELARRLFDRGGVLGVHVYSNVVTVELESGATTEGLTDIAHRLFVYYEGGPSGGAEPPAGDHQPAGG